MIMKIRFKSQAQSFSSVNVKFIVTDAFLAQLSQRLSDELIGYVVLCRPYVRRMYVCMSTFSNIFSSETNGSIKVKFHMEPPWDGGTKVCSTGLGLFSGTKKADVFETWYSVLGARVLPSLFK